MAEPLQTLKTTMLKAAPLGETQQRSYTLRTKLPPPTSRKTASFSYLQDELSEPSMRVHHDSTHDLWLDLDASKELGFGAMIFHVRQKEGEVPEGKWPRRSTIEPLLFLSKLLSAAKKNYWPTELAIAGFVLVIKKTRHLVESLRVRVIVQTDHSSLLDIMSTMRMNVRLVRASQFLCGFWLTIRHNPGKKHIVPDALNRLASTDSNLLDHVPEYAELDVLFAYSTTLVELRLTMLSMIIRGYGRDTWLRKIFSQVEENKSLGINKAVLSFEKSKPAATASDPYFQPRPELSQDRDLNLEPKSSSRLELEEDVNGEGADKLDSALA